MAFDSCVVMVTSFLLAKLMIVLIFLSLFILFVLLQAFANFPLRRIPHSCKMVKFFNGDTLIFHIKFSLIIP